MDKTSLNLMEDVTTVDSYVVYGRFAVFILSLSLWLFWWATKTDIGPDVFGYKGDNTFLQIRRQLAICSWWWQSSLILLSLTFHDNLWIDSLTIFTTLTFGGPLYDEYPKMRSLLNLSDSHAWDYLWSFLFNLSHHGSVSYVILIETNANKELYRPLIVWYWMAHSLRQMCMKYKSCITPIVSLDTVWSCYW